MVLVLWCGRGGAVGECDCDGNKLDCDGVCGGENTDVPDCSEGLNNILCADDLKDSCGNCFGGGMEEDWCAFFWKRCP